MSGFINIFEFFSKSEWIDLFSGILLWFTFRSQKKQFKSQKDQFKEQNKSTEKQFKEQNEHSKNQLKTQIELTDKQLKAQAETSDNQLKEQSRLAMEQLKEQMEQQNKAAKEQLEAQNELALKKEKRMLATKIKVSKYEEFHVSLQEYIELNYSIYRTTSLYSTNNMTLIQFKEVESEISIKKDLLRRNLRLLLSFCPELEDYWSSLFWSYTNLDKFIIDNITGIKQNISEQHNIEFYDKKYNTMSKTEYRNYSDELKSIWDDFYTKETNLNKLINDILCGIMNDLESDL